MGVGGGGVGLAAGVVVGLAEVAVGAGAGASSSRLTVDSSPQAGRDAATGIAVAVAGLAVAVAGADVAVDGAAVGVEVAAARVEVGGTDVAVGAALLQATSNTATSRRPSFIGPRFLCEFRADYHIRRRVASGSSPLRDAKEVTPQS